MAKDAQQGGVVVPVTYVDTEFRSRVIVFPDGSHVAVLAGKTTVMEPAHIRYMDDRPDFTRFDAKVI
ncbi:hypothetical protein [Burkholderia arboris]|uniref:hypothetical protein n=1 Tax=Burkholderia arboris TaxID=488730 RepID=UPI00210E3A7F|nr:hypothetical protein [Burkholderia arboris]UTV53960.1 hypothetical protein NLX30_13880 [Burkholderia arboris]